MPTTRGKRPRVSKSSSRGSVTPSLSGWTPTVAQKLSWPVASAWTCANSSSVVQMHRRAPDVRLGHGLADTRQVVRQFGKTQVAMGIGKHARGP